MIAAWLLVASVASAGDDDSISYAPTRGAEVQVGKEDSHLTLSYAWLGTNECHSLDTTVSSTLDKDSGLASIFSDGQLATGLKIDVAFGLDERVCKATAALTSQIEAMLRDAGELVEVQTALGLELGNTPTPEALATHWRDPTTKAGANLAENCPGRFQQPTSSPINPMAGSYVQDDALTVLRDSLPEDVRLPLHEPDSSVVSNIGLADALDAEAEAYEKRAKELDEEAKSLGQTDPERTASLKSRVDLSNSVARLAHDVADAHRMYSCERAISFLSELAPLVAARHAAQRRALVTGFAAPEADTAPWLWRVFGNVSAEVDTTKAYAVGSVGSGPSADDGPTKPDTYVGWSVTPSLAADAFVANKVVLRLSGGPEFTREIETDDVTVCDAVEAETSDRTGSSCEDAKLLTAEPGKAVVEGAVSLGAVFAFDYGQGGVVPAIELVGRLDSVRLSRDAGERELDGELIGTLRFILLKADDAEWEVGDNVLRSKALIRAGIGVDVGRALALDEPTTFDVYGVLGSFF